VLRFLEAPYVKYLLVTLFATLVSIALKKTSRPDSRLKLSKEDWTVGFDFAQIAIFAVFTDGITTWVRAGSQPDAHPDLALEQIALIAVLLLLGVVGIVVVAVLVRQWGWTPPGTTTSGGKTTVTPAELRLGAVIAVDLVGLFYLIVAVELFMKAPRP
jgi:hypothetical protein